MTNPEREAVARIIDPQAFLPLTLHHERSYQNLSLEDAKVRALSKADQILSLPEKGWRPIEGLRDALFNAFKDREQEWSALSRDLRAADLLRGHRGGKALAYREAAELVLKTLLAEPLPAPPSKGGEEQGVSRGLTSTPQSGREDAPTPTGEADG